MPIPQDLPPSTTRALETVYAQVLHPLLFPPREEHIQPILDSFINHHDQVLANDTVYTAKARIRETGVELDAVLRECRRLQDGKSTLVEAQEGKDGGEKVTLEEIRRMRLRCRLQSQAVSPSEAMSKERIRKEAVERRRRFDEEMKRLEEEGLEEFKEGLRNAVAL